MNDSLTRTDMKSNTRTFDEWNKLVDAVLLNVSGMTANDMADYQSHDTWDSENTPEAGAYECLQQQDFFDDDKLHDLFAAVGIEINDHI